MQQGSLAWYKHRQSSKRLNVRNEVTERANEHFERRKYVALIISCSAYSETKLVISWNCRDEGKIYQYLTMNLINC